MLAWRRRWGLALGAALLAALGWIAVGCSSSPGHGTFRLVDPGPAEDPDAIVPPPVPNSPENALRLLQWCYAFQQTSTHRTLFTQDYRFVFSSADPSGEPWRDTSWGREDELAYFDHFVGHFSEVGLNLDRVFRVTDDPRRPGEAHKLIRTRFDLRAAWLDLGSVVDGEVEFSLVRGDSALVPLEDLTPSTSLWYIERSEEVTGSETGTSWGRLKVAYH